MTKGMRSVPVHLETLNRCHPDARHCCIFERADMKPATIGCGAISEIGYLPALPPFAPTIAKSPGTN